MRTATEGVLFALSTILWHTSHLLVLIYVAHDNILPQGATMQRNAINRLTDWKDRPGRKPLLVYGARQVGKTHLLKTFANDHFQKTVYFDLEKQASARAAFEGDLEPAQIIRRLGSLTGEAINLEKTLIILDEVQASNRALASLKYFREEMPGVFLIGAGSLLGIAVNRKDFSAPVGSVEALTLNPMSFDEFLLALGEESMLSDIKECSQKNERYFLHDKALDIFRTYLLVGGMPEAMQEYISSGDFSQVREIQTNILDLYLTDMAKYASPFETARIREVWESLPSQLAKSNRKFQYKTVKIGGRASHYQGAIQWLRQAGLINCCTQVSSAQAPLVMHEDSGNFKVYQADCGLLSARIGIASSAILDEGGRKLLDAGAITENYIAQALTTNRLKLNYWVSGGEAEMDFLLENKSARVIPVEVKSSTNVRSRSLDVFRKKYQPETSIRLSTKNFGLENGIKSLPLYAAFCLDEKTL